MDIWNGDFASILQDQNETGALLRGGDKFGVVVHKGTPMNFGNIISLGEVIIEELPILLDESVPRGYEDLSSKFEKPPRILLQTVTMSSFPVFTPLGMQEDMKVRVIDFKVFPTQGRKGDSPSFSFELLDTSKELASPTNIELNRFGKFDFNLRYVIPNSYDGHLHRFLVFRMEGTEQIDRFSFRKTIFHMGVQVIGHAIHGGIDKQLLVQSMSNQTSSREFSLSVEAKPFVPFANIIFFDTPCQVVITLESLIYEAGRLFKMPLLFGSVVSFVLCNGPALLTPAMISLYLDSYRNNSMENVINIFNLNTMCNLAWEDMYSTFNTPRPAEQHLFMIGKFMILEELQMFVDIAQFDLVFTQLNFQTASPGSPFLYCKFKVSGSNENRPMISLGDKVRIRPSITQNSMLFEMEGVVVSYQLSKEEVVCEFRTPSLLTVPDLNKIKFNIRFSFERCGYFFIHQALTKALTDSNFCEALFPTEKTYQSYKNYLTAFDTTTINDALQLLNISKKIHSPFNEQQLEAIRCITAAASGICNSDGSNFNPPLPPLIIYGPPGTGKTSTVIETIVQLVKRYPNIRILACAPSDSAADVLCLRLIEHFSLQKQILRLNWWQRLLNSVPLKLLPFCNVFNNMFELPEMHILKSYQVVVATCGTAGTLPNLSCIPHTNQFGLLCFSSSNMKCEFDVVIIDEASQGSEAEIVVPLSLCRQGGVMVLSGDPNQLGPLTRSPLHRICSTEGLLSLQERLLRLPIYSLQTHSDPGNVKSAPLVFFLYKNYRSHKAILHVPSKMFYDGLLEECGDPNILNVMANWEMLPSATKNSNDVAAKSTHFPLLFVGVNGQHEHERESPSYYNKDEINEVVRVCKSLIMSRKVPAKDIGVIAAYRQQVLRLRLALRLEQMSNVNVGSVEDFQGQEVNVVVISTVLSSLPHAYVHRSMMQHHHHNQQHQQHQVALTSLGLMGNRRRFNVAVTRGMSLCVVIGHPDVLYIDSCWKELIEYIDANDSCIGHPCRLLKRLRQDRFDDDELLSQAVAYSTRNESVDNSQPTENSVISRLYGAHYDLEWRNIV